MSVRYKEIFYFTESLIKIGILNLFLALYTANRFMSLDPFSKKVFTWKYAPDSNQFAWNIKCKNNARA